MGPLHAQRSSWGRRLGLTVVVLVALALAGYVGSVVGPHFKGTSSSPTTVGSTRPSSATTSTVVHANVKVLVTNGTQEPNAAAHFTQRLQQQGWNVATPKNSTSPASATAIYYAPSQRQAALLVAAELWVPTTAVLPMTPTVPVTSPSGLDVVVVIGPDLASRGFSATTAPTV